MYKTLKITFSLSKKIDGSQVYFKIDGERFAESRTLKLHVDTTYKVLLESRPGIDISSVTISGMKVDGTSTKKDASLSRYEGTWSTSMLPKTSSKDRCFLPVHIVFEDGASIERSFQCKMYPLKDKTHIVWGTPLKCIEMKCSRKENENLVHLDDVRFL